jgi:hypothetical protein
VEKTIKNFPCYSFEYFDKKSQFSLFLKLFNILHQLPFVVILEQGKLIFLKQNSLGKSSSLVFLLDLHLWVSSTFSPTRQLT